MPSPDTVKRVSELASKLNTAEREFADAAETLVIELTKERFPEAGFLRIEVDYDKGPEGEPVIIAHPTQVLDEAGHEIEGRDNDFDELHGDLIDWLPEYAHHAHFGMGAHDIEVM